MAVDRVPVLKRCRSLGLDPIYLGIDKKSNRELKRANRKISEYAFSCVKSRKQSSSMAFWRNRSATTTPRLRRWKARLVRT